MKKLLPVVTVLAGLLSPALQASQTPVMFSTIDGFNAPNAESVKGVRLSVFHGRVNEVKGLDLAAFGLSETNKTTGVNLNFFGAAKVNQEMTGASLGIVNWQEGNTVGANIGALNLTNNVKGANISLVNYSTGHTLVDVGAVSFSQQSTVQVGLFNKTTQLDGIQIGLLNCADNGFFKCFPLVNWSKNLSVNISN
ncbi:phaC PHA synthase [Psychromonas sp. MB-3u-54]|uniref:VC2662 family protein n=1 Tax=Psychromonas sp. MB-3u-54 TaxID=2058319 RepID=UPI000C3228BF|nr:phaC PHA synthase [Psychromonas sp. MB-3u-54]PKH02953.1 phaC PHA synthase [Psychromonas sp. MB-3u-54]